MNLNGLTQLMNNFQGNNIREETINNKSGFENFFNSSIDNVDESFNLEVEEDSENEISYDFLQGILNNVNITEFKNFIESINSNNLNEKESLGLEVVKKLLDISLGNEVEFPKEISDKLQGNLSDDNEMFKQNNVLMEEFINKSNNKLDVVALKNTLEKYFTSKEESTPSISRNLESEDIQTTLKQKVNEQESYRQLEVNHLLNKNNLVEDNLKNQNTEDKDLNTLESILDKNNGNSFTLQNNNLNSTNLEVLSDKATGDSAVNSIRQEFIGEDIVKTVKYLKSNGLEEIKIKITPRELGDMTINLTKHEQDVKVLITLSKEETFDMVNKNIASISKHLEEMNINVKEITVDIKSNNQKFFSENMNQQSNDRNNTNKKKKNKYEYTETEAIEEIRLEEMKENIKSEENINILI